MKLTPLPILSDNYAWLLHGAEHGLVVDPGEAEPVLDALNQLGVRLQAILVTHHHADHTGGVARLRAATGATVFGPAAEPIPEPYQGVAEGQSVTLLGLRWEVLEVPGHTAGHIAWYAKDVAGAPVVFCGDTLFSAGCGRIFEGTPLQMLASLDRLASLPGETRICCAHEYTLANLRFARTADPGNAQLASYEQECRRLREAGRPTLPSTVRLERAINPFLRSRDPAVRQAVQARDPAATDEVAIFAALRRWKDGFR